MITRASRMMMNVESAFNLLMNAKRFTDKQYHFISDPADQAMYDTIVDAINELKMAKGIYTDRWWRK